MAPASNVDRKQANKTTSQVPVCEHSVNSNSHNNNIGNHVSVSPLDNAHPRGKESYIHAICVKVTKASGDDTTKRKVLALARDANVEWYSQHSIGISSRQAACQFLSFVESTIHW